MSETALDALAGGTADLTTDYEGDYEYALRDALQASNNTEVRIASSNSEELGQSPSENT